MGIAKSMKWSNEVTAEVAEALDRMGFEKDVTYYLDRHMETSGNYDELEQSIKNRKSRIMEDERERLYARDYPFDDYGLEWYIEKHFSPMYEQFFDDASSLDSLFIAESKFYVTMYNMVRYDQIARAYFEAYCERRNIGRGQTSRNSKTFVKKNGKQRTRRMRNGYRFLRIHQQVHARTGATAGRLSLGIRRLDRGRSNLLLRGGMQQERG